MVSNNHMRINIFLSSRFNPDVSRESSIDNTYELRDFFRNEIKARLSHLLGQLGGNVFIRDYEMGIPAGTDDTKVLNTCFEAIRNSDYFIFLLGRTPGSDINKMHLITPYPFEIDRAVVEDGIKNNWTVLETELETALRTPSLTGKCIFCVENTIINTAEKHLNNILNKINTASRIPGNKMIIYKANDDKRKIICDEVFLYFENIINNLISTISYEQRNRNLFFAYKTRYYVENRYGVNILNSWIENVASSPCVLCGKSGSGKSTLLSSWIRSMPESIAYFVGINGNTVGAMLDELYKKYWPSCPQEIADSNEQKKAESFIQFINYLGSTSEYSLVIIDGFNHLITIKDHTNNYWWLPNELPKNVKIIISTTDLDIDSNRYYVEIIPSINLLSIIKNILEYEGKGLTFVIFEKILAKYENIENAPIIAHILCNYVIGWSKYNDLEKTLASFIDSNLKPNDIYRRYINRINDYFSAEIVESTLTNLWCTQYGLTNIELNIITKTNVTDLIYLLNNDLLIDNNGRIKIAHEYMYEAVKMLWINDIEKEYLFRQVLSASLIRSIKSENLNVEHCLLECAYQYYTSKHTEYLKFVLSLIGYKLFMNNRSILLRYLSGFSKEEVLSIKWADPLEYNYVAAIYIELGFFNEVYISQKSLIEYLEEKSEKGYLYQSACYYFSLACLSIGKYDEARKYSNNDSSALYEIIETGKQLLIEGKWEKSLDCFNEAEKFATEQKAALISVNKSTALIEQHNYDKALIECDHAIEILERIVGETNLDTAKSYNNKALCLYNVKHHNEALTYYKKALPIFEEKIKNNPELATLYMNISLVYEKLEDYEQALKWSNKCLELLEICFEGSPTNYLAMCLYNRGALLYHRNEYLESFELYCRATAIIEYLHGDDHPDSKIFFSEVCYAFFFETVLKIHGVEVDFHEASKYNYIEMLKIAEDYLGGAHDITHLCYDYVITKETSKSKRKKLFKKQHLSEAPYSSFENWIGAGSNNPKIVDTYAYLISRDCLKHNDFPRALFWLNNARVATMKTDSKFLTIAIHQIAEIYYMQNRLILTVDYCERHFELFESMLGKNHHMYLNLKLLSARSYRKLNEYENALTTLIELVPITKIVHGEDDVNSATIYHEIGTVYYHIGEREKAISWFLKTLQIRRKHLNMYHPGLLDTLNFLALIYKETGNISECEKLLREYN